MYRFMEPDLTIYVMSLNNRLRAFLSHRKLLAQYSGYFKTLEDCETNKIFIPDITDDTFSIILSYVYTGMLKINNINIHSVLLATHTLHMPQASDMCRQFLITQDQNIIKPIAKLPSFTDASVIQQPNENRTLKISEESNFKPPIRKENIILDIASCDGPVKFYRVLNKNYKGDERKSAQKQSYNCKYCNHPFKSKRNNTSIQYYPCRQCGSKFPSYYFVHKHQKYCKKN
ncbi:zinc finger and BTB domain-containing protein 44 isoform X1 [Sipha flava]|uniref:Zinc finger and BTB domain-containing protein 44 isoform X1 n=1 Tax=Sipha flava TaxID=143950 RepID=A0A8B8G568_9HEMI|nr:zinc finger and BTB domain-containing protein 44 isoform X1 [Sipha flava]